VRLLIRRSDGSWAEPAISGHKSEDALQELLATSPDLLPGAETGLPMAVARDLPVSAGRIDLVGIDVEGELAFPRGFTEVDYVELTARLRDFASGGPFDPSLRPRISELLWQEVHDRSVAHLWVVL
jgi:hypothetical protein